MGARYNRFSKKIGINNSEENIFIERLKKIRALNYNSYNACLGNYIFKKILFNKENPLIKF